MPYKPLILIKFKENFWFWNIKDLGLNSKHLSEDSPTSPFKSRNIGFVLMVLNGERELRKYFVSVQELGQVRSSIV